MATSPDNPTARAVNPKLTPTEVQLLRQLFEANLRGMANPELLRTRKGRRLYAKVLQLSDR